MKIRSSEAEANLQFRLLRKPPYQRRVHLQAVINILNTHKAPPIKSKVSKQKRNPSCSTNENRSTYLTDVEVSALDQVVDVAVVKRHGLHRRTEVLKDLNHGDGREVFSDVFLFSLCISICLISEK